MSHSPYAPSPRLAEVRYEIRGELAHHARELEARGHRITRLNIGNPAIYGFAVPEHLRAAVAGHLPQSEAYCQEQGLIEARAAIAERERARGASNAAAEHVFIGNGVSELIDLALRALLAPGDEVLVPAPDYPLWTASVILNGGTPVHYDCAAARGFLPDPEAIAAQITPRTRAIVVINPNNPTGAVYPRALLARIAEIAARHQLIVMSDEIYDGLLYDGAEFVPIASLVHDTLCLSFGGLSKMHRACGWRVGWISLSGTVARAGAYLHGLVLLAALRLCSNVPGQWAIVPALTGPDTITPLVSPGGRLYETRRVVAEAIARSPHLRAMPAQGAMYAFPGVDTAHIPDFDDYAFALELLETEHVLLVPGSSFNVPYRNHFRITLLPEAAVMREVFVRLERALDRAAERARAKVA